MRFLRNASPGNERLYLDAIEIYREYDADGTLGLERETLHVLLDHRRIVTAETRTVDLHGTDNGPPADWKEEAVVGPPTVAGTTVARKLGA